MDVIEQLIASINEKFQRHGWYVKVEDLTLRAEDSDDATEPDNYVMGCVFSPCSYGQVLLNPVCTIANGETKAEATSKLIERMNVKLVDMRSSPIVTVKSGK